MTRAGKTYEGFSLGAIGGPVAMLARESVLKVEILDKESIEVSNAMLAPALPEAAGEEAQSVYAFVLQGLDRDGGTIDGRPMPSLA